MICEPFLYLVVQELQRLLDPALSPEQSTYGLDALEARLATGHRETEGPPKRSEAEPSQRELVLRSYLELDVADLEGLPPAVHTWFLERIGESPGSMRKSEYGGIVKLCFPAGEKSLQYLVVRAIVALDAELRDVEHKGLTSIWTQIMHQEALGTEDRIHMLGEITDLLVDLIDEGEVQTTREGVLQPSRFALEHFLRLEMQDQALLERANPLSKRVLDRAEMFGSPLREALRAIVAHASEVH
jgi:hypothetical protein